MVGLTSSDGALLSGFFPDFSQAGETKHLHQKHLINFCHLGTAMVTITRRKYYLKLF
jgi:hypothetical protein